MMQTLKMAVVAVYVIGMLMSFAMTALPGYGTSHLAGEPFAERVVGAVTWPLGLKVL